MGYLRLKKIVPAQIIQHFFFCQKESKLAINGSKHWGPRRKKNGRIIRAGRRATAQSCDFEK